MTLTHQPLIDFNKDAAAMVEKEKLIYMAYTGQYEFVYNTLRKIELHDISDYCDKYIISQAIWGSIQKLKQYKNIHNSDFIIHEKQFLIELLKLFIKYCEEDSLFPREIFQSVLYVTEELVHLMDYDTALKFLDDALKLGVNKYPDIRLQVLNRKAFILSSSGKLKEAYSLLINLIEHPYLISDRNKIAEILFNLSQISLKNGNAAYYKKTLFLGLSYFYSNAHDRKKFFDQLRVTFRSSLRLILDRDTSFSKKFLYTMHWFFYKVPDFGKLKLAFINKGLHKLLLCLIYITNYSIRNGLAQFKEQNSPPKFPALATFTNDDIRNRNFENISKKENILITRAMGGIGDLLMMTPGINALKRKSPKQEIHLAVPQRYFPIFEGNNDIKLVDIEEDHISHLSYKKWFNYTDCPAARVESRTSPKVKKSRIDIFSRSLGIYGFRYWRMYRKPRYFINKDEEKFADEFWLDHNLHAKQVIGVQLHSDETYRDYPMMDKLIEKISKRWQTLIFDDNSIKGFNFKNVIKVDSMSIRKAFALARKCNLLIAPDSSFIHFAAAFDISTIALCGPIDGKVRTKHYPECKYIDQKEEFGCIPCWRNENIPCKLTGMRISVCMENISINRIINEVEKTLIEKSSNEQTK